MHIHRLVPLLPCRDLAAGVAFYEKLGFAVEVRNDDWGWARLRSGEVALMLDRSIHLHEGIPRTTVLYLYPEDIADFHRRARENGLALPELDTTFYGMTEFRIEDPDGNRLWIGQDLRGGADG